MKNIKHFDKNDISLQIHHIYYISRLYYVIIKLPNVSTDKFWSSKTGWINTVQKPVQGQYLIVFLVHHCIKYCIKKIRWHRLPCLFWAHFQFNLCLLFFKNEVRPIVAGFAFCFHWRQKCWPLERDHIFHLILVYGEEHKAVFISLTPDRDGAHLCPPPPLHRTELNAGLTLYEWLFTRHTRSPQWSSSPAAGYWLFLMAVSLKTTHIDSVLCVCVDFFIIGVRQHWL